MATNPWSPWFFDQSKSGGVILDLSIHDIDYVSWILNSKLISVKCQVKKLSKYKTEVYGESKTKFKFENNAIANCEASWLKPHDFQFYTYTKILLKILSEYTVQNKNLSVLLLAKYIFTSF